MEKGVQNSVGPKQRMHETKSFEKKISYNAQIEQSLHLPNTSLTFSLAFTSMF